MDPEIDQIQHQDWDISVNVCDYVRLGNMVAPLAPGL